MKKKLLILTAVIAVVAAVALVFTACLPTDASKAKEKLTKAGYEVTMLSLDDAIGKVAINKVADELGIKGIESMVLGFKGSLLSPEEPEEIIMLYYFDTAKNAKAAYEKIIEKEIDEEDNEDFDYSRSGKIIYIGTKEAVKAVK